MKFKSFFLFLILTCSFFLQKNTGYFLVHAIDNPGQYIISTTEKAINALTDNSITQNEKEKRFGKLFDENFDVPSISRFVLGKYWKSATTNQKKVFFVTFRNYMVKTYSSKFNEYSGEKLSLLNYENEPNLKLFIVHTALNRPNDPPIKVDWRVGLKKDRYVILDIIIEGISLAVTQRSEFVSVIDHNDGNLDNLIKLLKEKYDVDFVSIMDENMTSNLKWTKEFCKLYIKEGLTESVPWGTLGDAPSVAVKPEIIKVMKDAGCAYISFGFESASNKVLNEDIQKGQLRSHLPKTLETLKQEKMTPLTTFMIGNPHENIDDLMETVDFWIQNGAEIDPFICTPYVGSPIFYEYKDYILGQYDERLKLVNNGKHFDENLVQKWKLSALDKFMSECGDAFQYTATVSQYFTIPDLFAIKNFMYRHDTDRLLKMAHQRYEETGKEQWTHSEKWEKYCPVCKVKNEFNPLIVK